MSTATLSPSPFVLRTTEGATAVLDTVFGPGRPTAVLRCRNHLCNASLVMSRAEVFHLRAMLDTWLGLTADMGPRPSSIHDLPTLKTETISCGCDPAAEGADRTVYEIRPIVACNLDPSLPPMTTDDFLAHMGVPPHEDRLVGLPEPGTPRRDDAMTVGPADELMDRRADVTLDDGPTDAEIERIVRQVDDAVEAHRSWRERPPLL